MNAANLKTFNPTPEQTVAAQDLMLAMAHRNMVAPIVTEYQTAILARHLWPKDERWREVGAGRDGHDEWVDQPVLKPSQSYLLAPEKFAQYLDECRQAQAQAKLVTESPDHCPKLVAEDMVWKAQMEFVRCMEPLTGLNWSIITNRGMDDTRRYIDVCLKLMAPHVGTSRGILEGVRKSGSGASAPTAAATPTPMPTQAGAHEDKSARPRSRM